MRARAGKGGRQEWGCTSRSESARKVEGKGLSAQERTAGQGLRGIGHRRDCERAFSAHVADGAAPRTWVAAEFDGWAEGGAPGVAEGRVRAGGAAPAVGTRDMSGRVGSLRARVRGSIDCTSKYCEAMGGCGDRTRRMDRDGSLRGVTSFHFS